jgi:hypothetical protein
MTMMDGADLRLDGNAVAGLLSEVFVLEATAAVLTCASCGAKGALASTLVYAAGPGTVLRCPSCTSVLMRLARVRGELRMDLRGIGVLAWGDAAGLSAAAPAPAPG